MWHWNILLKKWVLGETGKGVSSACKIFPFVQKGDRPHQSLAVKTVEIHSTGLDIAYVLE